MSPKKTYYETVSAQVISHFEKRGIDGYYCPDCANAVSLALSLIPEGSVVSWGGSMTLTECGLMDALKDSGLTLLDRFQAKTPEEKRELSARIYVSDYYFMSSNAITLDGELINTDGIGNRTSCLIAGPEHVIVMAGMNKLVRDVPTGMERVRNFAAPPNAVRLDRNTPCTKTGRCADCLSEDCICSSTVITRRSHIPHRLKVILIGEELGY